MNTAVSGSAWIDVISGKRSRALTGYPHFTMQRIIVGQRSIHFCQVLSAPQANPLVEGDNAPPVREG